MQLCFEYRNIGCGNAPPASVRIRNEDTLAEQVRLLGEIAAGDGRIECIDISGIATSKALIAGWKKDNPRATLGSFGPPSYLAVEVALNAIKKACDAGKGTIKNRKDIVKQVKKINLKTSILGGPFRFSTKSNDPLNAKFYIFQIQSNGTYKLVN